MNFTITTHDNIASIKSYGNDIFRVEKEGNLYFNEDLLVSDAEPFSFWVFEDYLIYHSSGGTLAAVSKADKTIYTLPYENFRPCPFGKNLFFMSAGSKFDEKSSKFIETSDIELYNIATRQFIAKYSSLKNKQVVLIENNTIVATDEVSVYCIDIVSDSYLWEYKLQFPGYTILSNYYETKISGFLGYYKGSLLIALSNNGIIAIDKQKGQLNWPLTKPENNNIPTSLQSFPDAASFILDGTEGKLYSFVNNIYVEIDAGSGTITNFINDYFTMDNGYRVKYDQSCNSFHKKENSIFFTTRHAEERKEEGLPESFPSLVKFDLQTKKITVLHEFEKEGKAIGGFKNFIFCKNNFYLLGGRNSRLYQLCM